MGSRWIVLARLGPRSSRRPAPVARARGAAVPVRPRRPVSAPVRSVSGRRRLVVHLEGQRERRVAGQPEPAHHAVPAQRAGGAHRVVVEAPGHRHPAHGLRSARRAASSPPGASAHRLDLLRPRAKTARSAWLSSLSATSRCSSSACRAACAASYSTMEAAGSSTPEVASSWATEARRSSWASSAARAASIRACSRSSRPAVQLRYRPTATSADGDPDEGCGHGRQGYRAPRSARRPARTAWPRTRVSRRAEAAQSGAAAGRRAVRSRSSAATAAAPSVTVS